MVSPELQNFLSQLDLNTKELDNIFDFDIEDSNIFFEEHDLNILPVSPKTQDILAKYSSQVEILKTGTNWQVVKITPEVYEELDHIGQFPYFDYGETINDFL